MFSKKFPWDSRRNVPETPEVSSVRFMEASLWDSQGQRISREISIWFLKQFLTYSKKSPLDSQRNGPENPGGIFMRFPEEIPWDSWSNILDILREISLRFPEESAWDSLWNLREISREIFVRFPEESARDSRRNFLEITEEVSVRFQEKCSCGLGGLGEVRVFHIEWLTGVCFVWILDFSLVGQKKGIWYTDVSRENSRRSHKWCKGFHGCPVIYRGISGMF